MKKQSKVLIIIIGVIVGIALIGVLIFMNSNFDNKKAKYIGKWTADGTQSKTIISVDSEGNPVYADDYDEPYVLSIYKDSTYLLELNDGNGTKESGIYQVDDAQISFNPDNGNFLWSCKLEDEKLECSFYGIFEK